MSDIAVITGAGLACSLGHSKDEVWRALLAGLSGVDRIEAFDAGGFDCGFAAQARPVDQVDLGVQSRLAGMMEKHLSMLMRCSGDALAQCNPTDVPREEIGFFAGMGMIDYDVRDLLRAVTVSTGAERRLDLDKFFSQGYLEIYPLWPLSMLNNVAFCQVAITLDLRGENTVFVPHADSGAQAVIEGVSNILDRNARVVIAGGVSETVSPSSLARAQLAGILARQGDGAVGRCRPFSAERNGTILGEGCAMLAIELSETARARGVPCLAAISGFGSACEVESEFRAPSQSAIAAGMLGALTNAGVAPSDIDVVIANGDGTYAGDRNEIEAINQVFSNSVSRLKVISSKGALGHLFAASPVVDIILAAEMLDRGIIPPTLNAEPVDVNIKFDLVHGAPLQADLNRVMVNSTSYEGQCSSLIVEKLH
jgi:3-oxoacyl-[acyl-carrier-protein] synthase II